MKSLMRAGFQQIRHGGGGGRPGGKPTFNWRQKMQLRLAQKGDKKLKPFKLAPSGDWEDIEAHFDESKGHTMVDITSMEQFEPPEMEILGEYEGPNDTRKQIDQSALFGPDKPRGSIYRKQKPRDAKHFSHSRVFGRNTSS